MMTMNSLDIDKPVGETRVVVAMSGGVDSSVTAALLKEQGYDVIGITLQLYDHGVAIQRKGACCAGQDIHDARQVAEAIDIPHYVLDYESLFRDQVMEDFADSYMRGETPIPCVRCNQTVKFTDLLTTARDLDADCLATGHYIRSAYDPISGHRLLYRGVDASKDQSYFLFATTQDQADFLRFPLGGLDKDETRALAARFSLPVAAKPDSQDICFVPNGDYASVIERLRPGAAEPGDIVHIDGRVMGRHDGIIRYTIGQRRGLGVGGEADPLYVVKLDAATKRVIVGPRDALATAGVELDAVNWLTEPIQDDGIAVDVKIRSTKPPVSGRLFIKNNIANVCFDQPEIGVAPGQAAVFYRGDQLLGGGWIRAATPLMGIAA